VPQLRCCLGQGRPIALLLFVMTRKASIMREVSLSKDELAVITLIELQATLLK